jgi:hypothetical protein
MDHESTGHGNQKYLIHGEDSSLRYSHIWEFYFLTIEKKIKYLKVVVDVMDSRFIFMLIN